MQNRFLVTLARAALGAVVALSSWLLIVNRVVIQWVDGPWKTAAIVALAIAAGAVGMTPMLRRWRGPWARAWLSVLAILAVGEVRRGWLRHAYHADEDEAPIDLLHPIDTTDLELSHFTISMARLPVERLRIVHVSDLHISSGLPDRYFQRIHDEIRAAHPDIIVMTGDFVSRADRIPMLAAWARGLPASRYGAFAVLGNHDYWTEHPVDARDALASAGVRVLAGECALVELGAGDPVRVCGMDEPWGPRLPALARDDVAATIVLSHTPDNVYALSQEGATAVFAGHTHGGQFRLPWLGAFVIPSRYGRRFDRGHFVVDRTHLFVSSGVGADGPPVRVWCRPEILVVDFIGQPLSLPSTRPSQHPD